MSEDGTPGDLEAPAVRQVVVDGHRYYIRAIEATYAEEAERLRAQIAGDQARFIELAWKLVMWSLCRADGSRLYQDSDGDRVAAIPVARTKEFVRPCLELNGLIDTEDIAGN